MKLLLVFDGTEKFKEVSVSSSEKATILVPLIYQHFGIEPEYQEVYHGDAQVDLKKSIRSQGISNHDTIRVVKKAAIDSSSRRSSSISTGLGARVNSVDLAAQRQIERQIQHANILRNMEDALEHSPESFARVLMLYVPIQIGGIPLAAFVDSGAQATIISKDMARKCGILRLLDERFHGVAVGVGSRRIAGRIHKVDIGIGTKTYSCALTVLDDAGEPGQMDFLLGLDMLRRHECMVDLKNDCLHVGDDNLVPFLQESQLPDHAKLTQVSDYVG